MYLPDRESSFFLGVDLASGPALFPFFIVGVTAVSFCRLFEASFLFRELELSFRAVPFALFLLVPLAAISGRVGRSSSW